MEQKKYMTAIAFLCLGIFLLLVAFFYEPLYKMSPELAPIKDFINNIGTDILYFGGFIALTLALFFALPTLASIFLFIMLMLGGSYYYLSNENISISITIDKDETNQMINIPDVLPSEQPQKEIAPTQPIMD